MIFACKQNPPGESRATNQEQTMTKHQLTYIDMHPQPVERKLSKLSELCAALTFAGLIALPFVLYFAFVMKP